jgi:hypothetical protein
LKPKYEEPLSNVAFKFNLRRYILALRDNSEVALAQAEWLYHRGDFQRCHDVVAELLEHDPFQLAALPCYLAAGAYTRSLLSST